MMKKLIEKAVEEFLKIEWREVRVNGNPTRYLVSNTGLIMSLKHNKTLIPYIDRDGYAGVGIFCNYKPYYKRVHRLVAEAFISNPENKPQINHIDGNKQNNHVSNLEWVTGKENVQHAWKIGLSTKHMGMNTKYSENVIHQICKLLEEGKMKQCEIADLLHVPKGLVSEIKQKKSWVLISSQYNIKPPEHGKPHNAKYTDKEIHQICKMLESRNYSYQDIMRIMNVNKVIISGIKNKGAWKHISDQYDIPKPYSRDMKNDKFLKPENVIHQICKLLEEGKMKQCEIAKQLQVNEKYVSAVKHGKVATNISCQYKI